MNLEMAVDVLRTVLTMGLMMVAPILGTAMGVGIMISLLQSVTSIQEQTLSFVPKLLGVVAIILVSSHWMILSMMEFTISFFERLPEMAP